MIIKKFNIKLKTLCEEDIELVRVKRNSDSIRNNMNYKEIITSDQQKKWFEKINSAIYNNDSPSFYFIINFNNEKIGLINGKDIDYNNKTSEGGFFIWEEKYLGSLVPVMTSLITLDYTFLLNDYTANNIKVIQSNSKALNFNKLLGYEITKTDQSFYYLTLTKERYLKKSESFRKIIGQETNDFEPLKLSDISFEDTTDDELRKVFPLLREYQQIQVLEILKCNGRIIF